MSKDLDNHKVYVEQYKTDMVPYSIAKSMLEELETKLASSTVKSLKDTVEDLKKDLSELSKLGKDISL